MKKRTKAQADKQVDKVVSAYLKENPKVKSAMRVFNMSKTEYQSSVRAKLPSQVITSSNTVTDYGHLARNN